MYYKLKHRKVSPIKFPKDDFSRKIRAHRERGFLISTVFIPINLSISGDESNPICFETMVFKDDGRLVDLLCLRCATHREALNNHRVAREAVKKGEIDVY